MVTGGNGLPSDRPADTLTGMTTPFVDLWPLAGVRVTSGDLELRYLDDDLLADLARLAADGVHGPDLMPFSVPWTRGTPAEVARSVLTYQWGNRASFSVDDWRLELGVVRDGEVLGIQGAYAKHYPLLRTAETGSWLGLRHQGAGVGTRMRLMILHLLFDGLGADRATTGAFADNARSLGVTRRLGYVDNGADPMVRDGQAALNRRFVMTREQWEARPEAMRPPVTLAGVEALRTELLPTAPEAAG